MRRSGNITGNELPVRRNYCGAWHSGFGIDASVFLAEGAGLWVLSKQAERRNGMGLYLNPDNAAFRQAVLDEIYIDKTELISLMNEKLNKSRVKNVCVSRPRRFGKSMAADMLTAYYSKGCDSGELFAGKK